MSPHYYRIINSEPLSTDREYATRYVFVMPILTRLFVTGLPVYCLISFLTNNLLPFSS